MTAVLDGTLVVDLTQGVSGPYCTRVLSQMGARVIKIERPGHGDIVRDWDDYVHGMCTGHAWINPGKESLALNLRSEWGRDRLLELVGRADVVIENFVPGTLESWGLGPDVLRERNPGLIICRISGYGQDGPYRSRPALDLIIQGETGVIMTNGAPDAPAKISMAVADLSGAMYSVVSILEAILHRERSGEGQVIDVALFDSLMTWAGYFPYLTWYQDREPGRVGMHHHTMCPYGPYWASDGAVIVAAGAGSRSQWLNFLEAIGRPDLVDHERFATNELRLEHREELDALINAAMADHPREYWLTEFLERGLPAGYLNEFSDALKHPRMQHRGMIKEVGSYAGPVKVLDYAPQRSTLESINRLGPPAIGEHTAAILAELGVQASELEELQAEGLIDMPLL